MIANDAFVGAFGVVPEGDEEKLIAVVAAAVRADFAIVLNKPDEKIPLCTLSARERNAADRKAKEEARELGDARWDRRKHPCGLHHALTVEALGGDPAKVRAKVSNIIRRVAREHGAMPNIGVELGRSRMLVVDVDTDVERDAWEESWTDAMGVSSRVPGMTVQSPGKMDRDGVWVHKNGGHYWFTLPEGVELPAGTGSYRAPGGWVAMWADHQVLVPPSHRPEGPYRLVGQVEEAQDWLTEEISTAAVERMKRAKKRSQLPDGTGDIDVWSTEIPWGDLLGPDGWTDTGIPDRCSCPIWTAPGAHASYKSATAHDLGCDRYDDSPGHAPLHIWTDNPPGFLLEAHQRTGSRTFTKIQYLAWRDYDGAVRGVLKDLGLHHGGGVPELPGFDPAPGAMVEKPYGVLQEAADEARRDAFGPAGAAREPSTAGMTAPGHDGELLEDDEDEEDDENSAQDPETEKRPEDIILERLLSSEELDGIPEPEPLVDGFLDLDTLTRVIGPSGSGKTFVMLDMAASVATGRPWHGFPVAQGLVIYMVAEGLPGFVKRLRAWELHHLGGERIPKDQLRVLGAPVQVTDREEWPAWRRALAILQPALVIMDTQARITVGVDENDNSQMGQVVERLEQIRRDTRACVLMVHHTGHEGTHGRGATAVLGALGAELRVEKPSKGFVRLHTSKQKDQEELDALRFRLERVDLGLDKRGRPKTSVVVLPDGWEPGADPFDAAGPGAGVSATSSVRDRLAAIVWHVFSHGEGATRAEARNLLINGNTVYGKAGKSAVYTAWNDLLENELLVKQPGKERWKLAPEEAERLALAAPAGPDMSDSGVDDHAPEDDLPEDQVPEDPSPPEDDL
jgi:hypothetical protein